eukprot:CAMPEP_0116916390 /NCGR_PEP_ID=MMETSP0467-20121206/18500_1 /TAXON_ID=283647 /ORGANISM="Mesodinium pulex, Strain SPMC105" /LENGTH=42 /DNA_ID= /DNA_START= /DNA_END= /DNA_ORIENTATION=
MGMFHGWGYYKWSELGDKYEGKWKEHKRHGYGKYVFSNGTQR